MLNIKSILLIIYVYFRLVQPVSKDNRESLDQKKRKYEPEMREEKDKEKKRPKSEEKTSRKEEECVEDDEDMTKLTEAFSRLVIK